MSNYRENRASVKFEQIGVRITVPERQVIEATAKRRGKTISQTVRSWIAAMATLEGTPDQINQQGATHANNN